MLDVSKDIHSLTEFKTKTPEFATRLREELRAMLLTVNGRPEFAVMSAATFQYVLEALQRLAAIQEEVGTRGSSGSAIGSSAGLAESRLPDLSPGTWRELREALLAGEASLMKERTDEIAQLFAAGLSLARARIAAEHPQASKETILKHLAQWLRERAGADFGDGPGEPVSPERLRRILNE